MLISTFKHKIKDKLPNKESLYWIIPFFLYLLSSQFSIINTDGVRDYLAAYHIVNDNQYTLVGPQMAFTFHIGPIWFYILSIPLLLTYSWSIVSFWIALLNAIKFYVAFKIGQKVLNKEFAIILTACLMLSSFTLTQQWTFTHSNLVEMSILLVIYFSMKMDKEKRVNWLIFGLLTGLAVHAHPTAGVVGYWLLLKVFKTKRLFQNGVIYLFGIITVFMPILIHQFNSNYRDIKATSIYFSHYTGNYDWIGFFKMVIGGIFYSSFLLYKTLFPEVIAISLFTLHLLFLLSCFIYGIVLLVKNESNELQHLIIKSVGFFCFTIVFLFLIRTNTPWYMTYAFTLSFSLVFALFIYLSFSQFNLVKLTRVFYTLSLSVLIAMTISISLKLNSSIKLPEASLFDIRSLNTKLGNQRYEFPAYLASKHGQLSCKQRPVTLNGPYAALIYTHSGVEHLAECGKNGLYYGQSNNMNNLFAVPHFFKEKINIKPISQIGNSYFYLPQSVFNGNSLNQEKFISDYDRKIKRETDWENHIKTAELLNGKYLVITKQVGFLMEMKVNQVTANNKILLPLAFYDYSYLYYCDTCDEEGSEWTIKYSESVKNKTNIVSF